MNVQSVMTANPACCTPKTPLRDVAQMMVQHDCGQIPVVDDAGAPLGVITDRDITVRMVASGRDTLHGCAADAMSSPAQTAAPKIRSPAFQCDGRKHCSQMSSCSEAKQFLNNCPGMEMDGDGDGIPCEQQLCTGLFGG